MHRRRNTPLAARLVGAAAAAVLAAAAPAAAVVPLVKPPTWRSIDADYATGGALVDVNGDGFLDLVTGNGNDMARQPMRVYLSQGGHLEETASWASADSGYNCHIDAGDFDGDGDLDIAVANLGDPGTPQRDKIYTNVGGALSAAPAWISDDVDNSFDLAWGDVDGDGDLDLAVACGETYTGVPQKTKIYRNDGGTISATATWTTAQLAYTLDVAWGDVDNDGDLDLALANEQGPNRVYRNNGGVLDTLPFWQSADQYNTLQVDWGDVDGDGWLDLAVADNAQLGGISRAAIYRNLGGTLETLPSWASTDVKQYYSAANFGDVDDDGDLDLASGGWWEPALVFENLGGTLETVASFFWKFPSPARGLVVESVVWGDLDNSGSVAVTGEAHDGDGTRKVFYVGHAPVRSISEVRVGGVPVPASARCHDLDEGWIALASAPPPGTGNVAIDYVYSRRLDLVVTNWDPDDPNIGFLNDDAVGVASAPPSPGPLLLPNRPNPFRASTLVSFRLEAPGPVEVAVFDASGRAVRTLFRGDAAVGPHDIAWDGTDDGWRALPAGVYFLRIEAAGSRATRTMTLLR